MKHGQHQHRLLACFREERGVGMCELEESVSLGSSGLTDRGVGDNTGSFEGCVSDLHVVIGAQFEDDRELACLSSNTVSDVGTGGFCCLGHRR